MSKLLVLFIHGLGGDQTTWGGFENLFRSDSELKDRVDVAFFQFPTKLLRFLFSRWQSLTMQEIADSLRTEIDYKYKDYSQVLLVCHSMGGLIAKRYVIETLSRSAPLRVAGLVFFATPHSGATLASAADALAQNHRHLRQLRKDTDFLDLVSRDWGNQQCESKTYTTYVVAGQDAVVDRTSAIGPSTSSLLIPDKGHLDVVKPSSETDLSFLIVRQAAIRLLRSENEDFAKLRDAINRGDSYTMTALLANRGRSWIETSDSVAAIELLDSIVKTFDPSRAEVVWSRYLLAIARLFLYKEVAETVIDDELIRAAEPHGLAPLFLGERMEFARKRGDREQSIRVAATLFEQMDSHREPSSAGSAYAFGTAHFLLGNLFRFGGRYEEAREQIERARSIYRPPLLSHQIELAHCQYATAVCSAMRGDGLGEMIERPTVGPEFRRFAEALLILARSHESWSLGRIGEAIDLALQAAQAFERIRFGDYGKRARSLSSLLEVWQRLELGASTEKAISLAPEHATVIRGMLGNIDARSELLDWIGRTRPSRVLGMLQFAGSYGGNWSERIGEFNLPPILRHHETNLEWIVAKASSLSEANRTLRELMGIKPGSVVPLIAD